MAKYCKHCGKLLEECTCDKSGAEDNNKKVSDMKAKLEENMGIPDEKEKKEAFEHGKKIVPDCIVANDGEIPIRQYDMAKLRTITKGAFAEGKLQVTNKRVLFRASGYSLLGRNQLQYEFAVNEIAGIEIRSDHRLGGFHFIIAMILFWLVFGVSSDLFEKFAGVSNFLSGLFSIILSGGAMFFFITNRGKYFIKLLFNSLAAGALSVQAITTKYLVIPVLTGNFFSYIEGICLVVLLINLILIAYVPNLVLAIKTKGASTPIEIRRKESNGVLAFMFNMPKKEYTGFADVMPGRDTAKAMKELGALINDINMLGDEAIEKWKENE